MSAPEPAVVTVTLNPAIDQTLSIPGFAAGRVNRVAASRSEAGGKGVNVACFLADLGIPVAVTGFLGAENPGIFEAAFSRRHIADHFVRIPGATRVGIKIVDDRTRETTDVNFPGLKPRAKDLEELSARITDLAAPGRWFVLSGSVPPGVPEGIYGNLIDSIRGRGGHVLLDTSGPPLRLALTHAPDILKPNAEELAELLGHPLGPLAYARAAVESLLDRGVRRVAVSLGADGGLFMERGRALLARPPRVEVRSTVGAGDAMVAGMVAGEIEGLALADLARLATASGAYAVTQVGPGVADREAHRRLASEVWIEMLS